MSVTPRLFSLHLSAVDSIGPERARPCWASVGFRNPWALSLLPLESEGFFCSLGMNLLNYSTQQQPFNQKRKKETKKQIWQILVVLPTCSSKKMGWGEICRGRGEESHWASLREWAWGTARLGQQGSCSREPGAFISCTKIAGWPGEALRSCPELFHVWKGLVTEIAATQKGTELIESKDTWFLYKFWFSCLF